MGKEQRHNAARTVEDKLGWSMTFLRAAEMERCALAYGHLGTLVDHRNLNLRADGGLQSVRNHVVELARSSITDELREIERKEGDG